MSHTTRWLVPRLLPYPLCGDQFGPPWRADDVAVSIGAIPVPAFWPARRYVDIFINHSPAHQLLDLRRIRCPDELVSSLWRPSQPA